jgi:hypothetical protein
MESPPFNDMQMEIKMFLVLRMMLAGMPESHTHVEVMEPLG